MYDFKGPLNYHKLHDCTII